VKKIWCLLYLSRSGTNIHLNSSRKTHWWGNEGYSTI